MSSASTADDAFLDALQDAFGDSVLLGEAIPESCHSDWTGHAACRPLALVRPASTAEVARLLKLCHEHRRAVVPQGGMTGLAGAAVPSADSVALSLARLTGVESVDRAAATLTVRAGTTLQAVQDAAEEAGFRYPVDFGARGTCQIGGTIATNAGGHAVIRHGMTRDRVLGLEVVLADGRVLDLMNTMIKNNTGYDLKHCFIGAEGTLGVITRAVLRLAPPQGETHTLLCALRDYPAAVSLLHRLRGAGLALEAFEVMWQDFYAMSCDWQGGQPPLAASHPLYVLCEAEGDANRLETALAAALEAGEVEDAVLTSSTAQARELWTIREATAEFPVKLAPINFDISLPIADIGAFVEAAGAALRQRWPGARIVNFGHIGDSNLHLTVDGRSLAEDTPATRHAIEAEIYRLVGERRGSISAEHGIGLLKRDFLHHSATPNVIDAMRMLKCTFDPRGILNPGKLLPADEVDEGAATGVPDMHQHGANEP
ncbi:FAD-binding oxidoreductase [Salinicola peritrichatus]|uniref:FAD-binding oxidoreductase n=1 Tax=Salinicola peritrichatus TaxID=1267424 RepID=UPI000DA23F53|nr:FAD-binding oxidoreductase [Salinicola peritrichatus]